MRTPAETLKSLQTAVATDARDGEYWISVNESLDLAKLTPPEIMNCGFSGEQASEIAKGLSRLDLEPLGQALNVNLKVRFRVSALREGEICTFYCDDEPSALWLKGYMSRAFPQATISELDSSRSGNQVCFQVTLDRNAPPLQVRESLLACPAIRLVGLFDVGIREQPHYRLPASELATWLDRQASEPWWTVDGDPLLMSRLAFPAPPEELAAELRKIDRPLLVADPLGEATDQQELVAANVDRAVAKDELGDRVLVLTWEHSESDWQLVEDQPVLETSGDHT